MGSNTARIGWIDEFKGFVLVLVCLFHVEQSFPQASMGTLHLSALRMSAFFFISGFLFSTRRWADGTIDPFYQGLSTIFKAYHPEYEFLAEAYWLTDDEWLGEGGYEGEEEVYGSSAIESF